MLTSKTLTHLYSLDIGCVGYEEDAIAGCGARDTWDKDYIGKRDRTDKDFVIVMALLAESEEVGAMASFTRDAADETIRTCKNGL